MFRLGFLARCSLAFFLLAGLQTAGAEDKNRFANVDPTYLQLRSVGLSGESVKVESLPLARETSRIMFKQGELYFFSPVAGQVTGAVFIGQGEFEMTPFLPQEQKHLKWLMGSGIYRDQFDKMVLRFADETYEELKQGRTLRTGAPNAAAGNVLEDFRKLLRKGKRYSESNTAMAYLNYNLDARLLLDLTWPGQPGLFWAFFSGKQYGEAVFAIDPLGAPVVTPEEVALVNLSDRNLGIWSAAHSQGHYQNGSPIDEEHLLIDQEHFKIEATAKGKRLDAVVQAKFKALVDGPRVLTLDLYSRLRMQTVKDDRGRDLTFIQEDKDEDADFSVLLPEGLKKGQEYLLTFSYGGNDAVSDSGGGNFTLEARTSWYPNSGFGEDRATFDMTLKAPKDLTMVATGQPVGEKTEGSLNVTQWKSDVPLGVAGFNYGKFKKSVDTVPGSSFIVETYANREIPDVFRSIQAAADDLDGNGPVTGTTLGSLNTVSMMGKALAEAKLAMALYTQWFGVLPYSRIAMTQQPFVSFGQAWPMLVYMPISAFLDSTFRHQLGMDGGHSNSFYRYVAAHEVSHQWWGHVLGWKSYRDQWLSEGFAEFSTSIYAQAVYKTEAFLRFWKELREELLEKNKLGKSPNEVGGVSMGYRLDTARTGHVTSTVIYAKGAFVLHMLRMMMWTPKEGDARFIQMIQDFLRSHSNQKVSTLDFQRTVEKHMDPTMDLDKNGKMDWFFNQWVHGTALPDYKLSSRTEAAGNGQTRLLLKISQSNVDDSFKMKVPIYGDINGKPLRLATVVMRGNSSTDELPLVLPVKPERLRLCAFEDVLCTTRE